MQQVSNLRQMFVAQGIEQNQVCAICQTTIMSPRIRLKRFVKVHEIDQGIRFVGHLCQMFADVAFVHRRDWMLAHHRVAIQAKSLVTVNREMVAEGDVSPKQGNTLHDGTAGGFDRFDPDVGGTADVADPR